ncbi:hypothetical protein [Methanolobus psychrotolerans]|nr:hypothetical protein [Methanolobus psychrotolerans]
MKQILTVTVDDKIIAKIEEKRGDVKRSTFVNSLLKNALKL